MSPPFQIPSHWIRRNSPNQNARTKAVSAIVLHADAASRLDSSLDWVMRPESQVSYHIMIGRNGAVYCTVPPERRAWHAGKSRMEGHDDVNAFSIGVCLANRNDGVEEYPASQYAEAIRVCVALCKHFGIPASRITTHAAVAIPQGRKTDPKGFALPAFQQAVLQQLQPRPRSG
jgi:N-acetyl-anhydromuramyl-L-alanine amidase AmpD